MILGYSESKRLLNTELTIRMKRLTIRKVNVRALEYQ